MAEHKPKQDDQLIGDAKANKPGLERPPSKPPGEKLKVPGNPRRHDA